MKMMTNKQEWFINKLIKEIEEMGYEFPMAYGDLKYGCNDFSIYRTTCKDASADIDYLLKLKEQLEKGRDHDTARSVAEGFITEEEADAREAEAEEEKEVEEVEEVEETKEEETMTITILRKTYEVEVKDGQLETASMVDQEEVEVFDNLDEAKAELENEKYEVEIETLKEGKRYYIDQHLIQIEEDEEIEEVEREDVYQLVLNLADEQL